MANEPDNSSFPPAPSIPPPPQRTRRLLFPLLLLAFVLVALLLLAEIALRLAAPMKERRDRYYGSNMYYQYNPHWVRFDPVLGFVNIPGRHVRITRRDIDGFKTDIRIGQSGYRDDEASLDNPQLLVLGDSYAFGWGVEQNETCEALLERDLGAKALNMGVSGYGTVQQYLQLRDWCRTHDMRGKTVLVLFFSNDWIESAGMGIPFYPTFASTQPCTETVRRVTPEQFDLSIRTFSNNQLHGLARRSELARRIKALRDALRGKGAIPPGWEQTILPPHRPLKQMADAVDCAVANMTRLRDQYGFNLIFAYVPSVSYYEGEAFEDADTLATILRNHKIPFIDLRPVVSRDDYWLLDRHWKPSGHRKAALAIEKEFRAMGLFSKAPR